MVYSLIELQCIFSHMHPAVHNCLVPVSGFQDNYQTSSQAQQPAPNSFQNLYIPTNADILVWIYSLYMSLPHDITK